MQNKKLNAECEIVTPPFRPSGWLKLLGFYLKIRILANFTPDHPPSSTWVVGLNYYAFIVNLQFYANLLLTTHHSLCEWSPLLPNP